MRAPSARTRKIVGLSAGPLAVLAAGALVWQGSTAAFTATTTSPANNWTNGRITLIDNDNDVAAFTVTGLTPGATASKCLTVTATSTVDAEGKIYASVRNVQNDTAVAKEFADHLKLTVVAGSGGDANCAGFTAASSGANVYAGSLSALAASTSTTPAPAGTAPGNATTSVQYKSTYQFDTAGLTQTEENALMAKSTGAELVWELKAGTGA